MAQWYVIRKGKEHGPFNDSQMREFATEGKLKEHYQVRFSGESTTYPALDTLKLLDLIADEPSESAMSRPEQREPSCHTDSSQDATPIGKLADHARRNLSPLKRIVPLIESVLSQSQRTSRTVDGHSDSPSYLSLPYPRAALAGLGAGLLLGLCWGSFIFHMLCGVLIALGIARLGFTSSPLSALAASPLRLALSVFCSLLFLGFIWPESGPPINPVARRVVTRLSQNPHSMPGAAYRELLAAFETHDPERIAPLIAQCDPFSLFTSSEIVALHKPRNAKLVFREAQCITESGIKYSMPQPVAFLSTMEKADATWDHERTGTFYETLTRDADGSRYSVETKDLYFERGPDNTFTLSRIVFHSRSPFYHVVDRIRPDGGFSVVGVRNGKDNKLSAGDAAFLNSLRERQGSSMRHGEGEHVSGDTNLYRIHIDAKKTYQIDPNP
jgi:hypothetical protein